MKFINCKITIIFILTIFCINLNANIDGIKIEIVEAHMFGKVHIPLVDKRIKASNDMFRLGYMQAGKSTKKLIKEDEFYIITLQDKYSKGKLNAIIKGDWLKSNPHNIGALTQVTFMLLQDSLGDNYDKYALEKKLNEIAKKVVNKKGFVLDGNFQIGYSDILLYKNGTNSLYKSYDKYVKPLETMIKNDNLTYDDAYDFVYDKPDKKTVSKEEKNKVKKVVPLYRLVLFLHIPKNTKIGTEIATLEQLRVGSTEVDDFEILNASVPFRINRDGTLAVSLNLTKDHYSFEAVAHTKDGDSNKIDITIVIDKLKDDKFHKITK